MMDLMNVLVERAPMHRSMRPVVPRVFYNEEKPDLVC